MYKSIIRKLETLQALADRQRPAVMTVKLATGEKIITDVSGAWNICLDNAQRADVVSVTTDTPGYAAAASILTVLCHPAENRRIADYEKC